MKLCEYEKAERKSLKKFFGNTLRLVNIGRVTFAIVQTGHNRGKIAWSIHSKSDGKFSRKFGEYVALQRLADNGFPIEGSFLIDEYDLRYWLEGIEQYIVQ